MRFFLERARPFDVELQQYHRPDRDTYVRTCTRWKLIEIQWRWHKSTRTSQKPPLCTLTLEPETRAIPMDETNGPRNFVTERKEGRGGAVTLNSNHFVNDTHHPTIHNLSPWSIKTRSAGCFEFHRRKSRCPLNFGPDCKIGRDTLAPGSFR